MRRVPILAWFLMPLLLHPLPALAGEMTAPTTWEGYLFKDEQGRLRVGRLVPERASVKSPVFQLGGALAEKLALFASGVKSEPFWFNTGSEEGKTADRVAAEEAAPRFLVRIRGQAEFAESKTGELPGGLVTESPSFARYIMSEGRVIHVEFITEEWLKLRKQSKNLMKLVMERLIGEDAGSDGKLWESHLKELLGTVLKMEEAGTATEEMREIARKIDDGCKVVKYFQKRYASDMVEFLLELKRNGSNGLDAVERLTTRPSLDIYDLFWKSKSRHEFLGKVRAEWKGDLGEIKLKYWVQKPSHGFEAVTRVDEIDEFWSDQEFLEIKAAWKKMGEER